MAVNINIPSQVKTYANLAAFPATGALKTIYIAEDTNKTYRWTGSVYTEISASAAMTWGAIGGTLSNQTDLQSALDAKVPTSRTLTINGVTQDLSANRTFTISTGITIGTTAIASGTVGRVLFEGAGNVVQESGNLFWDNTNGRLGIGTATPTQSLSIQTGAIFGNTSFGGGLVTTFDGTSISMVRGGCTTTISSGFGGVASIGTVSNAPFRLFTSNSSRIQINDNGNILINTTTDAGFKLDVNGTARVQGNTNISGFVSATNYLECRSSIFLRNSSGGGNTSFATDTTNCYLVNSSTVDLQIGYLSNYTFRLNNASRSIGIQDNQAGAATTDASALLTLTSTTKGFLPPRMTTTQKNAIASPAAGLMVYDTTLNVITYYNGTMWI